MGRRVPALQFLVFVGGRTSLSVEDIEDTVDRNDRGNCNSDMHMGVLGQKHGCLLGLSILDRRVQTEGTSGL